MCRSRKTISAFILALTLLVLLAIMSYARAQTYWAPYIGTAPQPPNLGAVSPSAIVPLVQPGSGPGGWSTYGLPLSLLTPAIGLNVTGSNAVQPIAGQNLFITLNVKQYGAIGDGNSHPLSTKYQTLAAAQAFCPHASSLSDELDWCAVDAAIAQVTTGGAGVGGIHLIFPGSSTGSYRMSEVIQANGISLWLDGDGKLATKLIWTNNTDGIYFNQNTSSQGGEFRLSNMSLFPATTTTHTALTLTFKIAFPTLTIEHVNFGGISQLSLGNWGAIGNIVGAGNSIIYDVQAFGTIANTPTGFTFSGPNTGSGHFHLYFIDSFVESFFPAFTFNIPTSSSIQGVYFYGVDCTNGGDCIDVINTSGATEPQWMITNSHWQGDGFFFNTAGSTAPVAKIIATGNFLQTGSIGTTYPGTPPTTGGGFNLVDTDKAVITSNNFATVGTDVATVYGVYSNGTNGQINSNTCENPEAVTFICTLLDTGSSGWIVGPQTFSGTVTMAVNNGANSNSIATGPNAVNLSTSGSSATGNATVVAGGASNLMTGDDSIALGGNGATDSGARGVMAFGGGGALNSNGDSEMLNGLLKLETTSTSPGVLTPNGQGIGSVNCGPRVLDTQTLAMLSITIVGRDVTSSGNDVSWFFKNGMLSRDTGVGTTTLTIGSTTIPDVTDSRGTGSSASVALSANTSFGCLGVSVTAPNSDTWDWVAFIEGARVQ